MSGLSPCRAKKKPKNKQQKCGFAAFRSTRAGGNHLYQPFISVRSQHKQRSTRHRSAQPSPPAINLPEQHFPRRGNEKVISWAGRKECTAPNRRKRRRRRARGTQLSIFADAAGTPGPVAAPHALALSVFSVQEDWQ